MDQLAGQDSVRYCLIWAALNLTATLNLSGAPATSTRVTNPMVLYTALGTTLFCMPLGRGRESSNIEPDFTQCLSSKEAPSEVTLTDLVTSSKRFPSTSAPLTLTGMLASTLFCRRWSSSIFRSLARTQFDRVCPH